MRRGRQTNTAEGERRPQRTTWTKWTHDETRGKTDNGKGDGGWSLEGTFERHSADWVADGQMASRLRCNINGICVLRASTVDVNDAEISACFHDVSVAIQHAQENT